MNNAKKGEFGQKIFRGAKNRKNWKILFFFICAKPNVKNVFVWIFNKMFSFFLNQALNTKSTLFLPILSKLIYQNFQNLYI